MKTIRYILLMLTLFIGTASATAQSEIIDEIADMKGVTSVYISKAMLSSISPSMLGDKRIASIAHQLTSIYIINIEGKEARANATQKIKQFRQYPGLEILTKIKEDNENVTIYGKQEAEKITYVLMVVEERNEISIIAMTGNISLDNIRALTAE